MWTAILSFLGGPVIKGLIDGYKAKLEAGNTSERIAADLAGRELEVQRREAEVAADYKRALIGHWYEPTNLFGYIMVVYFGKIIIWDKVLKLGVTDSITGQGAEWAGWIMMFYVGKRGFENVARILRK
jgi:hypothetical protein